MVNNKKGVNDRNLKHVQNEHKNEHDKHVFKKK